jgi:hypothetical protein
MRDEQKKVLIGTISGLATVMTVRELNRYRRYRKARKARIAEIKKVIKNTDQFLVDLEFYRIVEEN